MIKSEKGQGLVELMVAATVIVLVLGGVVSLMIGTLGVKTKGFDRKRATLLAQRVVEDLVEDEDNDPESFWLLSPISSTTMPGFEGYNYWVDFTNVVNGFGCGENNLGVAVTNCAEAVLSVGWSGSDEVIEFNRFFNK